MNFKEFMNLLIDDKLKGVYLFDSKEEFLNDTIIEEVRNKVNIPDFNLVEIKGNTNIETIKNSYETYPVMDEKKYIIWRNIDISKKSIKEYENTLNILADDFKEFPEFALLLIFSDNPPFKGKFYKSVAKNGKIVEINRLNQKELESFIGKRFVRNGKKIQKSLVREIVSRFSYLSKDSEIDLYEIVNVVDKIIASSSNEIVNSQDVFDHLDEVLNINIFNLTDSMSSKNPKDTVETFLKMTRANEDIFMIYHMVIRQIRNLIGVKSLYINGYNDSFMMKSLGIGSYELKKLKSFSRNFSLTELFDIHSRIFDMEYRQKSVDFDMELELLLLLRKISAK
ncbi:MULTISPECIES: DNA polymerase III subunit delta [Anaerococcus]|jgi:DNA polymerase III, delta subunit|uniref:DNA polymerase III subunit delta n=1 Tax=Anaerococcus octavius TaxID=54007 RepID=A0A2I1M8Q5_9FIRM|nr:MULTISPECIES: DNA polymerase III subunit delta [Anaerococcus]MDU0894312.1 DNA polymerase III subunit delta [Anaerococcus sp.]MDU3177441.1 DNA polymerase III subunit delta [Anaerococcus sp.]MDU5229934.1 DNA polymerase III subunit delta [Anaerococcus sp.]PKZ16488.1 DNA polymerase III subunit delta [Anaerococcus octavius]